LRFAVDYNSKETGTLDYKSIRSLCNALMSAPTGVPMEVHMEYMDYLGEKVVQIMVQNKFLTSTILDIADKLDLLMQP